MSSAITQPADQTSKRRDTRGISFRFSRSSNDEKEARLTNVGRVVGRTKDEFRRAVVPRTDVTDVRLALDQDLGRTKVAQLEDARRRVQEQVLRLDVAVADPDRVDVGERPHELVHVQFDVGHRHRLLEFGIVPRRAVHRLRNVLEDEVQVHLVLLGLSRMAAGSEVRNRFQKRGFPDERANTHLVAVRVEERPQVDYIRVSHESHNLQLAVLRSENITRGQFKVTSTASREGTGTHLEPLVLEHLLDGDIVVSFIVGTETAGCELGGKDDSERAVADDFGRRVGQLDLISGPAVRRDHLDHL